ncbi:MlaD family protein [Kovacikia minuta CCNUW1]|uniref:MlaD family protein n=1 Tax=Kovacikia minuta TaxID=2931930 RepID=UPI001CCE51F9|nr:MlaD family protein [Kovacikia minuta]UBF23741.1 MlaD family protein [Kovacikia minuta CCNUW1]
MRSRTIREGSVGLLILLGLGLFAGLILWLRGLSLGTRSYKAIVDFANIAGMEVGAPVRYRGVTVGKITQTRPGPNGVEVEIEIAPADLIIPRDSIVEASQSGLLGSTSIQILPRKPLAGTVAAKPLDPNCDSNLIVCSGDRLPGQIGVSVDELVRASTRFADVYSDPKFLNNVNALTKNTADAALEIARLSREFTAVAKVARQEISTLSTSAGAISQTANKLGLTADEVNRLLVTNRGNLVTTLENITVLTTQLRSSATTLRQGDLLRNLETLSANAAEASNNLRDVSRSLNSPANILALQQTLDSARATFQNAQKITSDLDELTGDPTFRTNLRRLVNGLSNLVSSTQQLQQQTQLAQLLEPIAIANTNTPTPATTPPAPPTPINSPAAAPPTPHSAAPEAPLNNP